MEGVVSYCMIHFSGISMVILPQRTRNNVYNVFIWTSLFIGLGMQMCLYSMEWYARQICPRTLVRKDGKFMNNILWIDFLGCSMGLFRSSIILLSRYK